MTHLLGVTHYDRFTVLDGEGNLITGLSFEVDQVYAPDGGTFPWTISELTAGMYQVSWVLQAVGTYYLRLTTDQVPGFALSVYEFEKVTDDIEILEEVVHYFTVRDDDGAYYSTAPIFPGLSVDPVGQAFSSYVVTLGEGLYRLHYTPDRPGVYSLRLDVNLSAIGDDPQTFEFEDRVVQAVSQPTALLPVHGSSLDDLVRAVALLCRDLRDTTATADTDATAWRARDLSAMSSKTIKGSNLFIVSAAIDALVGTEGFVIDSNDHTLSFADPLAAPPRRGDRGYLTNLESQGFLRQTYVNAINDQIQNAFPIHLTPAQWTFGQDELTEAERTNALFDPAAPFITPGYEFTHIYGVSYPSPGYAPYETHIPYDDKDRAGWWWDGANNRIVIGGGYRGGANGGMVQIRGYGAAPRLLGNTEQTSVSRKWLTEMTAGALIISLRDNRRMAEGQNHINRADAWLPELVTMVEPGTVRIR